jgi:hypothetical protein
LGVVVGTSIVFSSQAPSRQVSRHARHLAA